MSLFKEAAANRKYTDFYELYKQDKSNNTFVEHSVEPYATFRGCDVVDYHEVIEETNGTSSITHRYLTIETSAQLEFSPNDRLIALKDQKKWNISKVTISDDNRCKDKSMRPTKKTILELWW